MPLLPDVLYSIHRLKKGYIMKQQVDTVLKLKLKALMQLSVIQNTYSVDKELKKDLQFLRDIIYSIDENIVSEKQQF